MKRLFYLWSALWTFFGLMLLTTTAQAECFGPLCNAMHAMQNDIECLQGTGLMCGSTKESIQDLKQNLGNAQTILSGMNKSDPTKLSDLNRFFTQFANAMAKLEKAAPKSPDFTSALNEIVALRDKAHQEFRQSPPMGPRVSSPRGHSTVPASGKTGYLLVPSGAVQVR